MSLNKLAHRLNGTLNGRWINIRGPGHSKSDRSLGIRFDPAAPHGFYIHSLAGDDRTECLQYVKSLLAKRSVEASDSYQVDGASVEGVSNRDRAMLLWQQATPPAGTIVEAYLRRRRCWNESVVADVLRYHPNCPFGGVRVPAMLALITDAVTGKPVGVHRTALTDDGSDKRFGKDSKMMLGVATRGTARLHAGFKHLGIAEGIETALSASQVFGASVWATLSSGGIASFPILPNIQRLTVFADNDDPGLRAACACCRRYQASGIDAEIRYPKTAKMDWNDFLKEQEP
jgi:Toprim domain